MFPVICKYVYLLIMYLNVINFTYYWRATIMLTGHIFKIFLQWTFTCIVIILPRYWITMFPIAILHSISSYNVAFIYKLHVSIGKKITVCHQLYFSTIWFICFILYWLLTTLYKLDNVYVVLQARTNIQTVY